MPCTYSRLTVISGPSGVGKATVTNAVRELVPEIAVIRSDTTRPIRPGEVDGVNYNFVSDAEFLRRINSGYYLEHAVYNGYRYGTPRRAVQDFLEGDQLVLVEIEVQGAEQIRQAYPEAQTIFLLPVDWDTLERQLDERGTDSAADRAGRKARAREEVLLADGYGYRVINYPGDPLRAAELIAAMVRGRLPAKQLVPALFQTEAFA